MQGPRSLDVLADLCDNGMPAPFTYFAAANVTMAGQPLLITRTGWTGEMGFEIYVPETCDHASLWHHLMDKGAAHDLRFSSLSSMNIRRIEAGILNNGSDMDPTMTPFAAGIGQFVDLGKEGFIGREALESADRRPRLVGLKSDGPIESDMVIRVDGAEAGYITAAAHSPTLEHYVAYALFEEPGDWIGCSVTCGPEAVPGETVALPFYDADKLIPRGIQSA